MLLVGFYEDVRNIAEIPIDPAFMCVSEIYLEMHIIHRSVSSRKKKSIVVF